MLKNNKERENYFSDHFNWRSLSFQSDLIRVEKLVGYPIIAIKATILFIKPHDVILAYYQLSNLRDTALHDVYSKTYKQCIEIMRDIDNDKAN